MTGPLDDVRPLVAQVVGDLQLSPGATLAARAALLDIIARERAGEYDATTPATPAPAPVTPQPSRPPTQPPPTPIRAPARALAELAQALILLGVDQSRVLSVTLMGGRRPKVTLHPDDWRALGLLGATVQRRAGYTVHSAIAGTVELVCLIGDAPGAGAAADA